MNNSMKPDGTTERAALARALEAIPRAAYLVRAPSRVLFSNALGAEKLARETERITRILERAVQGKRAFGMTAQPSPGSKDELIVVVGEVDDAFVGRRSEVVGAVLGLTKRQREVFKHLVLARRLQQIALELGVGEGTIERHASAIFEKASVTSRAELATAFFCGVWG